MKKLEDSQFTERKTTPLDRSPIRSSINVSNYFEKLTTGTYISNILSKIFNSLILTSEEKTDFMNYMAQLRTNGERVHLPNVSAAEHEIFRYIVERYGFSSNENIARMIQVIESERSQNHTLFAQIKKNSQRIEEENAKLKEIMLAEKQKVLGIISKLENSIKDTENKYSQLKKYCKHLEEQKQGPKIDLKEIASMIKLKVKEAEKQREEKIHTKYKLMSLIVSLNGMQGTLVNANESVMSHSVIIHDHSHRNLNLVTVSNQTIGEEPKQSYYRPRSQLFARNLLSHRHDESSMSISGEFRFEHKNMVDLEAIEKKIADASSKKSQLLIQSSPDEKSPNSLLLSNYGLNMTFKPSQIDFKSGLMPASKKLDRIAKEVSDLDFNLKSIYDNNANVLKSIKSNILTAYKKFKEIDLKKITRTQRSILTNFDIKGPSPHDPFGLFQQYKHLSKAQNMIEQYFQAGNSNSPLPAQQDELHAVVMEEIAKHKMGVSTLQTEVTDLKSKNEELKRVNKYVMGVLSKKTSKLDKIAREIESDKFLLSKRGVEQPTPTLNREANQFVSFQNTQAQLDERQARINELMERIDSQNILIETLQDENFFFREKLTQLTENASNALNTIESLGLQVQLTSRLMSNLDNSVRIHRTLTDCQNSTCVLDNYYENVVQETIILQLIKPNTQLGRLKSSQSRKLFFSENQLSRLKTDLQNAKKKYQELENELQLKESTQNHSTIELKGIIAELRTQNEKIIKERDQYKNNLQYLKNELQTKSHELHSIRQSQASLVSVRETNTDQIKDMKTTELTQEVQLLTRLNQQLSEQLQSHKNLQDTLQREKNRVIADLKELNSHLEKEVDGLKSEKENRQATPDQTKAVTDLREMVENLQAQNHHFKQENQSLDKKLQLSKQMIYQLRKDSAKRIGDLDGRLIECEERLAEIAQNAQGFEQISLRFWTQRQKFKRLLAVFNQRIDSTVKAFNSSIVKLKQSFSKRSQLRTQQLGTVKQGLLKTKAKLFDYHKILDGIAKTSDFDFNSMPVEQILQTCEKRHQILKKLTELCEFSLKSQGTEALILEKLQTLTPDDFNKQGKAFKPNISPFALNENSLLASESQKKMIRNLKALLPQDTRESCNCPEDLVDAFRNELEILKSQLVNDKTKKNQQEAISSMRQPFDSLKGGQEVESKLNGIIFFMLKNFNIDLASGDYQEVLKKFHWNFKLSQVEFEKAMGHLKAQNEDIMTKFMSYEEEIYHLKDQLKHKTQELASKALEIRGDDSNFDRETSSDKIKIRNLQFNIKSLEKKIKVAKYVFEILGLNINDRNVKQEFIARMKEYKANPSLISIDERVNPPNKVKYRLYKIEEDEDYEDNKNIIEYPLESFKEIEIKSMAVKAMDNHELAKIKSKPNSDHNKLNSRNYFVTSFISYDKASSTRSPDLP